LPIIDVSAQGLLRCPTTHHLIITLISFELLWNKRVTADSMVKAMVSHTDDRGSVTVETSMS